MTTQWGRIAELVQQRDDWDELSRELKGEANHVGALLSRWEKVDRAMLSSVIDPLGTGARLIATILRRLRGPNAAPSPSRQRALERVHKVVDAIGEVQKLATELVKEWNAAQPPSAAQVALAAGTQAAFAVSRMKKDRLRRKMDELWRQGKDAGRLCHEARVELAREIDRLEG